MITVLGGEKDKKKTSQVKTESNITESTPLKELSALLVSKSNEDNSITLKDINTGVEVKLKLTGGSDIRDKYNQAITVSSLEIGEIVKATYKEKTGTLISLLVEEEYFTYKGISNWYLDEESKSLYIAENRYLLHDNLMVSRGDELLSLEDLSSKDELLVRGKEKVIFSIEVTKGHGKIYVTDYDDFIGGIAYVGKREIIPIVEDMIITARVGEFDLTFEHDDLVGTKRITLDTDGEVYVSMEEFKRPPVKMGSVQFQIKPNGADLFIDDKLFSYENPIDLEYGNYSIKVSLGGYVTYTGRLEVEEDDKSIYIDLIESNKEPNDGEATNGNDNGESDENIADNQESDGNQIEDNPVDNNDNVEEQDIAGKGYIYIQKPADASVYFDGEFKGSAPVAFKKEVGTHYITFIQTGYETKTYTVEVLDNEEDLELSFPSLIKVE